MAVHPSRTRQKPTARATHPGSKERLAQRADGLNRIMITATAKLYRMKAAPPIIIDRASVDAYETPLA
jgi:hypothetical protein